MNLNTENKSISNINTLNGTERKPDIKIFVSHRIDMQSATIDNSLCIPIRCGAIYDEQNKCSILGDDTGENISTKRNSFCELTVQYWAWKNIKADYYGLFHYRRYLSFSENNYPEDGWGEVAYYDPIDSVAIEKFGLTESNMLNIIPNYDVIVPRCRKLPPEHKSVYYQYCSTNYHHKEDLEKCISILLNKYPEYKDTLENYLKSNYTYDCNMFIMRRQLFFEYSSWLFDILNEFEKSSDFSSYNMMEKRAIGFLGERLFSIWFLYNRDKQNLKTLELQRTLFYKTERPLDIINTNSDSVIVVTSSSSLYVPYCGVLLQSLIQNSSQNRQYEIYVLTTDITEEQIELLRKIVEIDNRFSFKCINVTSYFNENLYISEHISKETYYRLVIPSIFAKTKKILYLDVDMIINEDIANLFDIDIEGFYLAGVRDIDIAGKSYSDSSLNNYIKKEIGIKKNSLYFQAGCLLLNIPEMKKKYSFEALMQIATSKQWRCWDQDILNYAFNNKVLYLKQHWNTMINWSHNHTSRMDYLKEAPFSLYTEYLDARKKPKIIHYAGFQKPWNTKNCDMQTYFWKYARQTIFYEEILQRFIEATIMSQINFTEEIAEVKRKLSSRKFLFKWVFGKTLLYRILRKIYRIIKR